MVPEKKSMSTPHFGVVVCGELKGDGHRLRIGVGCEG